MTAAEATPELDIVDHSDRAFLGYPKGLGYLAFFAANSMVGWVGGWYSSMPTTTFWLVHAGFAAGSGAVFVLFKLFLSKRLMEHEPAPMPA
jgi:proton-dependent oligopeptide transporter, POT family